jgi:hypothetical protein
MMLNEGQGYVYLEEEVMMIYNLLSFTALILEINQWMKFCNI